MAALATGGRPTRVTPPSLLFSRSMRSCVRWLSRMMLMRRLIGLRGSALSRCMLSARPITRSTLPSVMPPVTSSRREALARSADSSQLPYERSLV
jgi:hypothetical protein